MTERILLDGDVVIRELRSLRRVTLNRPSALNAVTLAMAVTMTEYLQAWADDPAVGAILLDGAGARGFCAGGDIRALYDAARTGDPLPQRFWATEYRLNVMIKRYPKPVIAIMDGVVMGGGVGLSIQASYRVVTDRSAVAMPEVAIGFFPDVGVSFSLARAPGYLGTHLALTGDRIGAADAIFCGLADFHIAAARLAELAPALADCRSAGDVAETLLRLATAPHPGRLPAARPWIDQCYDSDDVGEIIDRLRGCSADAARAAREAMDKASPTSLKVTLRNLRAALRFDRVERSFEQDYRIALACVAGHDFIEGIRAAIVDKDRNPAWRPDNLAAVTPDIVDRHFNSVGALELHFPN
jgi:enoyl-CoA hydratase